jgi:hypothetical protein
MFQKLCGDNALQNIVLVITMWDDVDEELGSQRENELEKNYWKGMLNEGSKTSRHLKTPESAWAILDNFLQPAHQRQALQLQKEMVDLQRQLNETKAGKKLFSELENCQDAINNAPQHPRRDQAARSERGCATSSQRRA